MRRVGVSLVLAITVAGFISCGDGNTTQTLPRIPRVSLSVSNLSFSGQVVGTTSPAQTVTLTNTGTASLAISNILPSGDFAVTPACGTTVAASGSCVMSVTFAPLSGGPQTGSIIITDNATGSPHTVMLTGTGMGGLVKLSSDMFTNTDSWHATEVEPDTFAFNSTIVSVFQVGRFFNGGASDIGFATSTDSGANWTSGFLPGITKNENAANPYDRVSDPVIAYDAAHAVWLAASLPIFSAGVTAPDVIVNRSTDGGIPWGNPITVNATPGNLDKPWIACDNWPASPFFGNCYVEWDANAGITNLIQMSTSSDGGLTWSTPLPTANGAHGIGGQPVVQPNGTVVVPIGDASLNNILSFTSTDGGASWTSSQVVSAITDHTVGPAGLVTERLRAGPLPSAEVDGAGNVYVVWQDCRFRAGCALNAAPNDIVLSKSSEGVNWSTVQRIPIDDITSTVDHFIPGIAVDPSTSGNTAHLALTYYYYPVANCTVATCELNVGFISSDDGGATWSSPTQLAGPMSLSALPLTNQGVMVGDYISTSYVDGFARGAFAVANPKAGLVFDEAIYTTANGLTAHRSLERRSSAGERPVPNARSDHPLRSAPAKIR